MGNFNSIRGLPTESKVPTLTSTFGVETSWFEFTLRQLRSLRGAVLPKFLGANILEFGLYLSGVLTGIHLEPPRAVPKSIAAGS